MTSSAAETGKARQLASQLVEGANKTYLEDKYVVRSMEFYNTIRNLMQRHHCNAFTIECFEFCSSRLPDKWDITPCVIHTLFKDQDIASACEADLGALLSMRLLMSIARKSSHLGNMFHREPNILVINHSAPGIKMNGFGEPGLPYQLGRFVHSGWGTKAVVDFMNNAEKRVTVARMNPAATKVLLLKGRLVGSSGWGDDRLLNQPSEGMLHGQGQLPVEFVRVVRVTSYEQQGGVALRRPRGAVYPQLSYRLAQLHSK